MSKSSFVAAILSVASMLATLSTQSAGASEFGCKVLLCAASSNPSWRQIDTCIPPMTKLIACRAAFFSPCAWPVCEEAGTGEPGYEKYAACPTGWSPHQNDNHGDHASVSGREADLCIRRVPEADRCKKRDCSQSEFETMNRPLNNEPYYFDIKDDGLGTTGRHWFEMN